jgi:hypothetical protein
VNGSSVRAEMTKAVEVVGAAPVDDGRHPVDSHLDDRRAEVVEVVDATMVDGGRHPVGNHLDDRRVQRVAARIEVRERREAARLARRKARTAARREVWSGRWLTLQRAGGRLRPVAPLLVVNSLAVYGQIAYAYERIAPEIWPTPARLVLAVMFATAVESISLYVGWHAHDALLRKHTAAAAKLRRIAYLIAAAVGTINYAHFAAERMTPTSAAVAFGLLSMLSPWLWGLHSRRAQHIQLVAERKADCIGAVFSAERRRSFPIRCWKAKRWSIDNGVTDPLTAWQGYNAAAHHQRLAKLAHRAAKRAARKGEAGEALLALQAYSAAVATTLATPAPTAARTAVTKPPTTPTRTGDRQAPTGWAPTKPRTSTTPPAVTPTTSAAVTPTTVSKTTATTPTTGNRWAPVAIRDAAFLRETYGTRTVEDLPGRNELVRLHDWNPQKASDARNAYLAGADLTISTATN